MDLKYIYEDCLAIKKLKASDQIKIKLMQDICGQREDTWKVIGITAEAILVFKNNDYRYVSRMGINRSHYRKDRVEFFTDLLKKDFSFNEWCSYLCENDRTIFSLASENAKNKFSRIYEFSNEENHFRAKSIGWRHNKEDREFLSKVCESILRKNNEGVY